MSNFLSIAKAQFLNVLNTMFGKKKTKSTASLISIVLLIMFGIGASFASMYLQMAKQLSEVGMTEYVFIQVGIVSVLFVMLMITIESHAGFFKSKDYEFLASLPIKPYSIVLAKFLTILGSAYLYTAMTLIPGMIIYFVFAGFTVSKFFLFLLIFVLFPLLPTFFGTLLGLLSAFISSKVKNTKFFNFALVIVFVGVYVLFSVNYQNIIQFYINNGADFLTALVYVLPSLGLFMKGVFFYDWLALSLYVVFNVLSVVVSVVLVSALYKKINISFSKKVEYVGKKKIEYKPYNTLTTLLKNEKERYFGTSVYLFNTLSLALIGVIMPIVFYFSNVFPSELYSVVPMGIILTMIISISMSSCNTSCVSISMEGSKFQTLKSLPIKPSTIINSKILFNMLVVIPFSLLASILSICFYHSAFEPIMFFAIILLPLLAVFGCSLIGMIGNLYFPKMKFENYNQVVKQSASSAIGIFGSMVFSAIPFALQLICLSPYLSVNYFVLFATSYFIVFDFIFALIIYKKGTTLFNKIQA